MSGLLFLWVCGRGFFLQKSVFCTDSNPSLAFLEQKAAGFENKGACLWHTHLLCITFPFNLVNVALCMPIDSLKSGNNYKIIFEKDWQCVSCALCAIVNNPRPIRHLCIHTWHAYSTLCQRRSVGTGPGFTILNIFINFDLYCPPLFFFSATGKIAGRRAWHTFTVPCQRRMQKVRTCWAAPHAHAVYLDHAIAARSAPSSSFNGKSQRRGLITGPSSSSFNQSAWLQTAAPSVSSSFNQSAWLQAAIFFRLERRVLLSNSGRWCLAGQPCKCQQPLRADTSSKHQSWCLTIISLIFALDSKSTCTTC